MVDSPKCFWVLALLLLAKRKRMVVMGGVRVVGDGWKLQLQVEFFAGIFKPLSFNAFLAESFTKAF